MSTPLPDICLNTLNGESICLKDLRGKTVLLSFWVSWCPSCREHLPKQDIFFRSLDPSAPLAFYTVNVTGREADPSRVVPFVRELGLKIPVLVDSGRDTYDALGLTSVPSTVLIDPQGTIRGIYDETVPFMEVVGEMGRLLP